MFYLKSYCNGESDTNAFVRTVVNGLSVNGRVDAKRLADLTPHLEWVSRKLFGQQTATTISRMIELEVEITNKPKTIASTIFFNTARVNNLNLPEKNMLAYLHDGLGARLVAESAVTEPVTTQAAEPEPTVTETPAKL